MSNPLTQSQKAVIRSDVAKAIGEICDAWPRVVEAQVRGYPAGSGNGPGGIGGHGDPTSVAAFNVDRESTWLANAQAALSRLAPITTEIVVVIKPWSMELRVTQRSRHAVVAASRSLIEQWPKNVMRLFQPLYDLSNQAKHEWPPTRKATKADILASKRAVGVDVVNCSRCGRPVMGNAGDPIVRIDDRPYDRACYMREHRSRQPLGISRVIAS